MNVAVLEYSSQVLPVNLFWWCLVYSSGRYAEDIRCFGDEEGPHFS